MLRRVIGLDVFELTPLYAEHVGLLSYPAEVLPKPGIIIRIIAFIWHLIDSLLHVENVFSTRRSSPNKILFYAQTINQRNALQPVREHTPNSCLVGTYKLVPDCMFPEFWAHVLALPFFPLVFITFLRAQDYRRRTFWYILDQYWLAYGYYITATLWLKKLAPRALVVSNDHNMPCMVMAKAAKDLNIPTIYLQHASITHKFPPLRFDYALLDGEDALRKYDQIGNSNTKVFLIGVPKLDSAFTFINRSSKVQSVGICTNGLDPLDRVDVLCQRLRYTFPDIALVIRPHPGDERRNLWLDLAQRHQAGYSDSRLQLSTDFLRSVDAVIVGESNILLEATVMNVFPIHYDFLQKSLDAYGFIKQGLTRYNSDPDELCEQLQALLTAKPDVSMRAKYYCATLGTHYAGSSSLLAASLIHNIAFGKPIRQAMWRKACTSTLEAYDLVPDMGANTLHETNVVY